MNKPERLVLVFAFFGVVGAAAYWVYLYVTDSDNAPSFGDMWETIQSIGRRAFLAGKNLLHISSGDSSDAGVNQAVDIIAQFETFSPKVYDDEGHQAIGYGHDLVQGDGFDSSSTISEADAYALLVSDVESRFAPVVDNAVQVQLSQNQRAALISLVYNIGAGNFRSSTMLRLINQGNFDGAAAEFQRWIYAGGAVNAGLQSRRDQEQSLFES